MDAFTGGPDVPDACSSGYSFACREREEEFYALGQQRNEVRSLLDKGQ